MITYLLQVSFCWIFFYLVYYVFLRRETFFSINRWYLLFTLLLGISIPPLGAWIKDLSTTYPVDAGQVFLILSETPAYIDHVVTKNPNVDWLSIVLMATYFMGGTLVTSRFIKGLAKIYRLYKSGEKTYKVGFTLVSNDHYHLPFSFFRFIFISRQIPLENAFDKIIRHELTHVKQWHSIDILITELLHIIFWFNPILHFYRRALQQSHEYYADACVLQDHQLKDYGQLLLDPHRSGLEIALTNQFFNSHLKNRISMMYQKKSARPALAKYLVSIPILLLALFLFSNSVVDSTTDPNPFKKEVKDAIQKAESMGDLSKEVMAIIKKYEDSEQMNNTTVDQCLREIGQETGIFMELMFGKNFNFSQDRNIASKSGYLEHLDRIYQIPAIYTKLIDLSDKIKGRYPLMRVNGNLIFGYWASMDPDKILAYKYIEPEEAIRQHGDMAYGGIIDFTLTDFTPEDLYKYGVVIESGKGVKPEKNALKKVDTPARFPGCEDITGAEAQLCGLERFNEFVADVMQYPEEAKRLGIEGTVMVRFLVTDKGAIGSPKILNDIGGGCGDEAKYLIQSMNTIAEQWTPATKDGKPVKSIVTMPIKFSLNGEVSKKEFSARHESNLAGDIKKPMPEVMQNPQLTKEMIALLSDFEISPRPIFVVDGEILEKDSVRLKADQVVKAILLDEDAAAVKYKTVNQRALEIYTKHSGLHQEATTTTLTPSTRETNTDVEFSELPFITDLTIFPNPAKYSVNLTFHAPPGHLDIRIHDTAGKLLHRESLPNFNGTYNKTLYNSLFVNTEAVISFMQDNHVQTSKLFFTK